MSEDHQMVVDEYNSVGCQFFCYLIYGAIDDSIVKYVYLGTFVLDTSYTSTTSECFRRIYSFGIVRSACVFSREGYRK